MDAAVVPAPYAPAAADQLHAPATMMMVMTMTGGDD